MAFIKREEVAAIRKELKKAFPEIKFSIRNEHHSWVHVTLMESPYNFGDMYAGESIMEHNLERDYPDHAEMFEKMFEIILNAPARAGGKEWFDDSDSMTDYFHTAYYYSIEIGKWDNPYKVN